MSAAPSLRPNPGADLKWANRALGHARAITNASPGRGSATEAEANAARYVRSRLSRLGIQDVREQAFTGSRSIWLFLAVVFGLALLGHAAFWLLRFPLGAFPALAISALAFGGSAFLFWQKFTYRGQPLRDALPNGPSQNVIAVLPARKQARHTVVLSGHLDSQRAVWCYATDGLVKMYAILSPLAVYGIFVAPVLYALAAISSGPALIWAGVPLAAIHFVAWFTGMTADLGPYSRGANDNASGLGTVMALAERLQQEQLQYTDVWLVTTGCKETGCEGMQVLLDEYGERLEGALFVNFELVGKGERPAYLRSEGLIRKLCLPERVESLVLQAGRGLEPLSVEGAAVGVFTETGLLWRRGAAGVCLVGLMGESLLLSEWHRLSDTPDRLNPDILGQVHALAWRLLQLLDRTAARDYVV